MPSTAVNLDSARTRADLAASLRVPKPALDLVSLRPTQCTSVGCTLSAAEHNYGRCILCRQVWFPRAENESRRGHGLFGNEFLRGFEGKVASACCCASPLCEKIGYSASGMFRFPKKQHTLQQRCACWTSRHATVKGSLTALGVITLRRGISTAGTDSAATRGSGTCGRGRT